MKTLEPLADFCHTNDLPWDDRAEDRFATYLEILEHFNQSMNLIGPLSAAEIVDQLFIDSLTAAAVAAPDGAILDVGTGAGLPGIPLKILYPECPLTLVEPRKKRGTFLKIARTRLDLDDTTLERCRIEELDAQENGGGRFDYCISKAFREPSGWLEAARPFVADGGRVVCMTRPEEEPAIRQKADALGLAWDAGVDDVTELGAPAIEGGQRAVYVVRDGT